MDQFVAQHWKLLLFLAWVASNFVSTMPSPSDKSGNFYRWLFGSLHGIFGNGARIGATLFPQYAKFLGVAPNGDQPKS